MLTEAFLKGPLVNLNLQLSKLFLPLHNYFVVKFSSEPVAKPFLLILLSEGKFENDFEETL